MRTPDAQHELTSLIDRLSIRAGSIVLVHSDMSGIPLPRFDVPTSRDAMRSLRTRLCEFLFVGMTDQLGETGTLVVPTFSYTTTDAGGRFDLESTPSEVGPFSEYVRQQPGALRSFHPIFSLSAIGPNASEIVDGHGPSAFGPKSPWQTLTDLDADVITLGVSFHESVTYAHHLEHCFGVPHRFHKALNVPMYRNGTQVEGIWLAYLRYRGINIDRNFVPLEDALREQGLLIETEWNGIPSSAAKLKDVEKVGYELLNADPWAFATQRVEMRFNEHIPPGGPFDGKVANVDVRIDDGSPSTS